MGGTASSAFLMSFEKFPIYSLVTWATFQNLPLLLWPIRSPHTHLLLALARITLRLTLTSTSALYCTSHVQSPLLKCLVMKKRIRRMSSCWKYALSFSFFFSDMPYLLLPVSSSFDIAESPSYCLTQYSTQMIPFVDYTLGLATYFLLLWLAYISV